MIPRHHYSPTPAQVAELWANTTRARAAAKRATLRLVDEFKRIGWPDKAARELASLQLEMRAKP